MTTMQTTTQGLAQNHWRKIKSAPQRLVLCRLMIDIMRTVHGAYAPDTDRFGTRLETFFIGLCVALGDIEDKPLTVAKVAVYMSVPRTTVIRRLNQLQKWGLIEHRRHRYYIREKTLNSARCDRPCRRAAEEGDELATLQLAESHGATPKPGSP